MSIAFESPTHRAQSNEAYFTPLNMPPIMPDDAAEQPTPSTPYFTAPINPAIHQDFLNAIHARHANQPTLLSPSEKRLPTAVGGSLANRRRAAAAAAAATTSPLLPSQQQQRLVTIDSEQLASLMAQQQDRILILDVRSFVQYSQARLQTAINVSVPNTILKRPTFTIDKVYEAIVLDSDRSRLQQWKHMEWIVFYDQSTLAAPQHCAATFLSAKLDCAGYKNNLAFLKGGYDAFAAACPDKCETNPLPPRTAAGGSLPSAVPLQAPSTMGGPAGNGGKAPIRKPKLHLDNIPMVTPSLGPFTAPMPKFENQSFNPFFSNIRQNMEMAHGPIRERFPVRLPPDYRIVDRHTGALTSQARRARQVAGSTTDHSHNYLAPDWLREKIMDASSDSDPTTGPQRLAEMYEKLERTEQRRLQNIMHFHSKHSTASNDFPLSIVAGIEMGALNRYTNIWPFEYTRVKMNQPPPSSTGYINASYIQYCEASSPCTSSQVSQASLDVIAANNANHPYRRYISTQGPLPATFADFWQVVWEQNSRVLVMLTKEEEMNKIKCHRYWPDTINQGVRHGDMTVTLLSETVRPVNPSHQGSFDPDDVVIIRQLVLSYKGGARRPVTHLQYTGWVDFGVPDSPTGTLLVIQAADEAQQLYEAQEAATTSERVGPMVVHCSAGCGRSGAFCAIDTVLRQLKSTTDRPSKGDLLYDVITRFREQRLSMVQTLRQFVFCYEAIWWWVLGYGHAPAMDDTNMDTM